MFNRLTWPWSTVSVRMCLHVFYGNTWCCSCLWLVIEKGDVLITQNHTTNLQMNMDLDENKDHIRFFRWTWSCNTTSMMYGNLNWRTLLSWSDNQTVKHGEFLNNIWLCRWIVSHETLRETEDYRLESTSWKYSAIHVQKIFCKSSYFAWIWLANRKVDVM